MDIAREYLTKLDKKVLDQQERLKELEEILRKGFQYPMVELKDILELSGKEKVGDRDVPVLSITMRNGLVDQSDKFNRRIASEDISAYKAVFKNQLVVGFPIDEGVLSFQQKYDIAAVSPAYDIWEIKEGSDVIIGYLEYVLRSDKSREIYKSKMIGAAGRRRSIPKDIFKDIQIPLPPLEVQNEIVDKIGKQMQIIEGAESIEEGWKPEYSKDGCELKKLSDVIELQRGHDLPKYEFKEGDIPVMGSNGIIGYHNISKHEPPGVITGRSGTIGKVHFIETGYWPHNTSLFVKDYKGNNPKFIYYLLQNIDLKSLADNTTAVPSLDRKNAYTLDVHIPPIDIQCQIVEKLDQQMQALDSVRLLKSEAQKRIEEILAGVWGEE